MGKAPCAGHRRDIGGQRSLTHKSALRGVRGISSPPASRDANQIINQTAVFIVSSR